MVVDVVRNPQKSNVYEYEKKHVRFVGVFSGMMYGCVRHVLRVARADFGWGTDCGFCKKLKNVSCEYNRLNG